MCHKKIIFSLLFTLVCSSLLSANQIQVLSAVKKDQVINDATVIFQKTGESSLTVKSDKNGVAQLDKSFDGMESSETIMLIKKDGYSTLVAKCPCNGLTYALSPKIDTLDGIRIVLNWGNDPRDLDAHLVFANNNIFWDKKKGDKALLDVDDTDAYGPETVTIEKKKAGQKYVYAVHDYSNRGVGNTKTLGNSQASVRVYIGRTLIRTYNVKAGSIGNTWVVFGIDENGAFFDIEKYLQTNRFGKDVEKDLTAFIGSAKFVSEVKTPKSMTKKAKQLNHEGEKVYHEKKLEKAMYLFQDAINLDSKYGQAYSNLGLTYQKLGRVAEAIWANRKAIELADGKNKHNIQASSYYNIARIYESQNKYQDALDNFEKALKLKEHTAYHQGIKRMQEKLNDTSSIVSANSNTTAEGKYLYRRCAACHGVQGEKAALGKSKLLKDLSRNEIKTALQGYLNGTYGGEMKGLMKGQAAALSSTDIETISEYIASFQ